MYGIRLTVRTDAPSDALTSIQDALRGKFPEDENGLVWVNAATDTNALAVRAAEIVWDTTGAYCEVTVDVDWSKAMPGGHIESVCLGREEYERLIVDPESASDEELLILCEHWGDLNDAAIEAVGALAEISKRYPDTAFEVTAIGCSEYPYHASLRAGPPAAGARAYLGRIEQDPLPQWAEVRAALQRSNTTHGDNK